MKQNPIHPKDFTVKQDTDKLLSREAAAETLGVQPNTLAVWAMKGTGPAPTKGGTRATPCPDDHYWMPIYLKIQCQYKRMIT